MTTFSVDGHNLDDPNRKWFVEYDTSLPNVPSLEVAQLKLPSRSGVVTRRLAWDVNSLKVSVIVPKPRSFGDMPDTPAELRVRELQSLLARAREVAVTDDGVTRLGEVVEVDVSEPARLSVSAWRVDATFTLQPFWVEDGNPVTQQKKDLEPAIFTRWAGTTGDVQDAIIQVRGPFTRLQIEQDGKTAIINGRATASQFLFFKPNTFRAWAAAFSLWEPANPILVPVDYGAGGPLTSIVPGVDGVRLNVTGDGFDGNMVALRGRKWWL